MADYVPNSVLESPLDLIRRTGHDPAKFVEQVGLPRETLQSSQLLIKSSAVNRLLELASAELGERFFGLKASKTNNFDSAGPLWTLARNARTVGEELTLLTENFALITGLVSTSVSSENVPGKLVAFDFRAPKASKSFSAKKQIGQVQMVEMVFGTFVKDLRRSLGREWHPDYVQFMHAAPDDKQPLQEVFGENIFFEQDVNAFHLSDEDFSQPSYMSNKGAVSKEGLAVLRRENEIRTVGSNLFIERVRRIIRTMIIHEGCTAGVVAQELGLPVRTLRYRLAKKNISYQTIYDETRLELARHYLLLSDMTVTAIAERLHFGDSAAFSNFFKRHAKKTPRDFRRQT